MLGNILVALLGRLQTLQAVEIILVDEVFDVALNERRIDVEQVLQLILDLETNKKREAFYPPCV